MGLYHSHNEEEHEMNISARNALKGRVKHVAHGAVNTEVTIELPGGTEIVSIITKTSAERLNLAQGKEVYAVIKASNVMIATD
jgi:molybdopterin-binding protein